jgi:hypothetical protein
VDEIVAFQHQRLNHDFLVGKKWITSGAGIKIILLDSVKPTSVDRRRAEEYGTTRSFLLCMKSCIAYGAVHTAFSQDYPTAQTLSCLLLLPRWSQSKEAISAIVQTFDMHE